MKIEIKIDITKIRKRGFRPGFAIASKKGRGAYSRKTRNNQKWKDE